MWNLVTAADVQVVFYLFVDLFTRGFFRVFIDVLFMQYCVCVCPSSFCFA